MADVSFTEFLGTKHAQFEKDNPQLVRRLRKITRTQSRKIWANNKQLSKFRTAQERGNWTRCANMMAFALKNK